MLTLEARNIVVNYGLIEAIHGVSFKVDTGKVVAFVGSNGAGKSTTLKALMGLLRVTSGEIYLGGERIDQTNSSTRVSMGVSLSPEGRRLFPRMSVWENLMVGAHTVKSSSLRKSALEQVYELFPKVLERRNQQAGSLSGGEQQMVAIGRALMSRPKVLMLDEPSLGIAPKIIEEIAAAITRINIETKISVILVEQNARLALQLSDDIYVFEQGLVIRTGTGKDILSDEFVKKAYLGI